METKFLKINPADNVAVAIVKKVFQWTVSTSP